jgi:hypothetical protein
MRFPKLSVPKLTTPKMPSGGGKPTFTPRPDINGNKPGGKPTFTPRPDINGNLPGKKPGFNLDGFKPANPLGGLKPNLPNLSNPLGGLKPNLPNLSNPLGGLGGGLSGLGNGLGGGLSGLGSVLGGGLSAAGGLVGGVASGAAGLLGAGMNVAGMLPGALGMLGPAMDPSLAGGVPQDLGAGPVMDPSMMDPSMMDPSMMDPSMMDPRLAGGVPQDLGAGPMMDPSMMDPSMMDPRLAGGVPQDLSAGPMMDPSMLDPRLAGGVPQELGAGPEVDPSATQAPAAEEGPHIPSADDKRPAGDNRSAADIVKDSPALAHLGRQKDIKFDQLCKQTGVDPKLDIKDSKQNPDAVYRLAKVLEFIDSSKSASGGERSGKVQVGNGDGNIEGITKGGDARHGTEAGVVKDFAEQGYGSLGSDHQLPTTNDSHVKEDGSNKDNFQWFAGEAGKNLWFLPGVSNVLTGIGNSEGGALGALKGGLGGMVQTWKGAAEGVIGGLTTGKVNPLSMALGAYTGALQETTAAPQAVKDIASMLPF